jgi:hypothetical protein
MNLHIDFTLIIALLVLVQLFVLSVDVSKGEKSDIAIGNGIKDKTNIQVQEIISNNLEENNELSLVVYRSNGEEKIYKKSDAA